MAFSPNKKVKIVNNNMDQCIYCKMVNNVIADKETDIKINKFRIYL